MSAACLAVRRYGADTDSDRLRVRARAWLRWWAVAVGWSSVVGIGDPLSALGAAAWGAANGAVGAAAAIRLRPVLDASLRLDRVFTREAAGAADRLRGPEVPAGRRQATAAGAGVSRRP
jgi:hypothetical protein